MQIHDDWKQTLADADLASAASFWKDGRVRVWRSLPERENATLDLPGRPRLHVKRFRQAGQVAPELNGIALLERAGIPTLTVIASGEEGGRGVLVTRDLVGLSAGDALLRDGVSFETLLEPTADLAAKLHRAGLHHRDLYLCHFFARPDGHDLHLIDAARVRRLPWLPGGWRRRWIVKDVAQFVYSLRTARVRDDLADAWQRRWAAQFGVNLARWQRAISGKVLSIAARDARGKARARDVTLKD